MADTFRNLPNPLALLLALVSGALITLSFAPFNLWPITLLSLTAFALLLGMGATTTTADPISAILFGAPGQAAFDCASA